MVNQESWSVLRYLLQRDINYKKILFTVIIHSNFFVKIFSLFEVIILSAIPHINSETNPPTPIINVVYVINSKEAGGKACEIWLKLRLHKDMANFQTLQTWIGHNATRYHNLNGLSQVSPYIFSEICLILGYLQCVTVIFWKNY